MKILFDTKGRNNRFKVVKKNQHYYLYERKFGFFWLSDGNTYESKQDATHAIPF
ncbi:hypothetical protein C942_02820 [Photobacterium marinum]|uniref:Uncharacterized protein n=1 Tax=Photobacterium marinum TaxID=1056511 RepID=L8J7W4_9GAMM|nr:hypothetical protein C942_02820 [Photobacterium marinum]